MRYCIPEPYKITVVSCLFKPLKKYKLIEYHEVIIKEVGASLGVSPKLMKSKSKKNEVFEARIIAINLIIDYDKNLTQAAVGKMFNRNHASVNYAKKQIKSFIETDATFKNKVELITAKIKKMERPIA